MMPELLDNIPELQEDERTIVSTRVFNAPRQMVYERSLTPRQVVEWWGPHGFDTTILEMDLRPGGKLAHGQCMALTVLVIPTR